jgi:chromosomal replication initiator protein
LSTFENTITAIADRNVCDIIAELLIERIGTERFEMWFGSRECIQRMPSDKALDADSILVVATSTFTLSRIKTVFGSDLRTVVDRVCGPQIEIQYRLTKSKSKVNLDHKPGGFGKPEGSSRAGSFQTVFPAVEGLELALVPAGPAVSQPSQVQFEDPSALSPSPDSIGAPVLAKPSKRSRGLKSFWFGDENRLAEASVAQLFEQPGQFTPFFVYGPTGSGKTHLLEAIVNDFRNRLRCKRCVMMSAEQFTSLFVASLRGGDGLPMFRRKYRELDLLVIDDIQFLAGKRATVSEFYHTLEILVRSGKQVVLSADRPAIELGLLGGDLGNRLSAGLSCPLRYPGLLGRIEVARGFCKERNIQLTPKVIEFIAERLTGDVRRMSGALNRLHAHHLSFGESITVETAETELCDLFTEFKTQRISLGRIEAAICDLCGLKPAQLKSGSRQKPVATARMLAMYLSREYTSSAFSEIGNYYGGRSHSTVIAAQKQVHRWLESNQGVALPHATYRINEVMSRLKSNLRIG